MKLSTDGLTLGCVQSLNEKGYSVVVEEGGMYANIALEAPLGHAVGNLMAKEWDSLTEYTE